MDADRVGDVGRRAALHGVLSDPGRLAVVDMLAWGDRSPSELAEALGMASNLLAHHVNVLVDAGVARRHRSEGDRRRTYVSLVPGALDGLTQPGPAVRTSARVVFVCTANSARSQLAAALWSHASDLPATSGGTRPAARVAPGALRAARRHHLTGLGTPRAIDQIRTDGDYVVTVCDLAHEETGAMADSHWSVPDPVPAGDDDAFEAAITELERRVADLAPRLTPLPATTPTPAPGR